MATKVKSVPAAKAKSAPKKVPSTALTLWEQEMEAAAVDQGSTEVVTGGYKAISLKSGILSVDDNAVDDNELRVIVLASIHENQFYAGDYDPAVVATPICYAFGDKEEALAPHEAAPEKQHRDCATCANNEWGSADKGTGKACKNVRRLLCITEDALESAEALEAAEARMLKVPVMSVRNWSTYVQNTLAEVKRPSWGVVTRLKVVPDARAQFKVQFHFEELIGFDQALYDAMGRKVVEAKKAIGNAYPVFEEEEAPPKKQSRRVVPIKTAGGKVKPAPAAAAKGGRGGKY